MAVMPCTKSNTDSGGRPSSSKTVSMILAVSGFEKPRRRRNSERSSSERATILRRAAWMPATKAEADESAKLSSAGAASSAKRDAAYLEWRIVIYSNF